jgi:hypothetical protein
MRHGLALFIILLAGIPLTGVQAQEIVSEPYCFLVKNEAPYKVYGSFVTDYYTRPDGIQARHRSNFRLEEVGAVHETEGYPLDVAEFCSYGPFYPDKKLELVIRTLVPIFSCKTKIDQGTIVIQGERKPEGGTDTRALCFE